MYNNRSGVSILEIINSFIINTTTLHNIENGIEVQVGNFIQIFKTLTMYYGMGRMVLETIKMLTYLAQLPCTMVKVE